MTLAFLPALPASGLALGSGALVGLVLALVGGGGSILAVPLLAHVVGLPSPHLAIGTAAVAVALNAASGLLAHARAGTVKWRCAAVFAAAGIAGAWAGAALGKALDGQRLLALFGLVMVAVGAAMLLPRRGGEGPDVKLSQATARRLLPRLLGAGLATGAASGFFGIGGGFLIVPALVATTGMPLVHAIGTSLVAVTAFGAATAGSYALSGLVDWPVAGLMALGGLAGSLAGAWLGARLASRKRALALVLAVVVIGVGGLVTWRAALSG